MKLVKKGYGHDYTFAKMPKFIFEDVKYKDLKSEDILLYTLIVDRISLSNVNDGYTDEDGNLFAIMPVDAAAGYIRMSEKSARNSFKRLQEAGLIHVKRMGLQKPNRIYLVDTDSLNGNSYHSGLERTTVHDLPLLPTSNTDSIKTDINNNTQDTNKTDITDKKTKTYTTLSSGGFFLKHYGERFKSYFKTDHREISQEDLITLSTTIEDITHELNIDRVLYTSLVDYHFKHLSTKNNGHIKAFVGRKNDSPLYRYINELV